MKYVMGFDGGGTKTAAVLMDDARNVVARHTGASSNVHSNPDENVRNVLRDMVEGLLRQGGIAQEAVAGAVFSMAGCDSEADRRRYGALAAPHFAPSTRVEITNDAVAAMRACLGTTHGILVISGTGSICLGRNEITGTETRAGGWGHLLADEGSGFWIGLEGLRAFAAEADGRGIPTALTPMLFEHLALGEPRDLLAFAYDEAASGGDAPKARIASIGRLVAEAARGGDAVCTRILERQAADLASLVPPVYRRLFPDGGAAQLGLWGGTIVHNDMYRGMFLAELARHGLPVEPVVNKDADAAEGAANYAWDLMRT